MSDIQNLVSVIIPIYNMEQYLLNSVATICNQTYQNIEIILVDDGSVDGSLQLCNNLQRTDKRIKVISKENGGVSSARNVGITQANGDWIMFVDPDDCLELTIIESLLGEISDEIDIVSCCCKVFDDNGLNDVNHFFAGNRSFRGSKKNELYFQLMQSTYGQPGKAYTAIGVPWGKIYRRDFLKRNNILFDIKLKRVQDNIFNMYAFFYAREVKYVDAPLYKYRYEHMSGYFSVYRENYADIFVAVREARYKCLIETGLLNNPDIWKYYLNETAVNLVGILKNGVFHKNNIHVFFQKKEFASRICEKECFKCVLKEYHSESVKYNFCLFLIKNKLFHLFALIVRLS